MEPCHSYKTLLAKMTLVDVILICECTRDALGDAQYPMTSRCHGVQPSIFIQIDIDSRQQIIDNRPMKTAVKLFQRFATLNSQAQINKLRNAVRFEAQNLYWDYQEANYQTQAFAKGLASLDFQPNDNLLLRVSSSQQAEAYIAKLGTAAIGANLILSQASSQAELDAEIKSNNIKSIIFEPTLSLGQDLFIDALNNLIPELAQASNGQKVNSSKYGSLSALIQTNFYSYPGVYKFRNILNYVQDKYFKLSAEEQFSPLALPASSNPLFVTETASSFAFKAGVLNSNINGRYLVVAEPQQINRIAEFHGNKVDLVGTEEIAGLHPQINVFVEKGSQLFLGRSNRIQL